MTKRQNQEQPKRPTTADGRAPISIKATVAFRDWLSEFADSERLTTVQLIEKAVVEYAERRKYPKPAPRRTEGR
jgi:hypothetical protein